MLSGYLGCADGGKTPILCAHSFWPMSWVLESDNVRRLLQVKHGTMAVSVFMVYECVCDQCDCQPICKENTDKIGIL